MAETIPSMRASSSMSLSSMGAGMPLPRARSMSRALASMMAERPSSTAWAALRMAEVLSAALACASSTDAAFAAVAFSIASDIVSPFDGVR